MPIVKNVEYEGSKIVSTNSGNIELNQSTGELIIRKDGKILTRVNSQGFIYSEPNGRRRILIGAHPVDGHIIDAKSKPGVDVVEALGRTT